MKAAASRRFVRRLCLHGFTTRLYFYVPMLVHHLEGTVGDGRDHAITMTLLALFSVGISLADYPSGAFADWAGRRRSLVLGALLHGSAVLLLMSGSIPLLALAQLVLGVGIAFRQGADTSLLYSHLERIDAIDRYGRSLAMLRFWNVLGLTLASSVSGLLYAWAPASVFWLTAAGAVISVLPLLGIDEPPVTERPRPYQVVFRAGLAELVRSRRTRALLLVGGVGSTYFTFTFWATQSFLVDTGASPQRIGYVIAAVSLLQASSMWLSARLTTGLERMRGASLWLLVGLPLALLAAGLAGLAGQPVPGGLALICAGSCAVLYRNVINVRLLELVPGTLRASMLSIETWIGSVVYIVFFPLAGLLLDAGGLGVGYLSIAGLVGLTALPLLMNARRRGVWRDGC